MKRKTFTAIIAAITAVSMCGRGNVDGTSSSASSGSIDPSEKKHVGKYSLGMKQRLGIAQAIMEDPDILILAEPMNGLGKDGMRELLLQLRDAGKTMIVASHNSVDIDVLCDRVFEIAKGDPAQVR